ncbi:MAG: hypothetical protein ACK40X_07140 [Armatimonadota bacterium]
MVAQRLKVTLLSKTNLCTIKLSFAAIYKWGEQNGWRGSCRLRLNALRRSFPLPDSPNGQVAFEWRPENEFSTEAM